MLSGVEKTPYNKLSVYSHVGPSPPARKVAEVLCHLLLPLALCVFSHPVRIWEVSIFAQGLQMSHSTYKWATKHVENCLPTVIYCRLHVCVLHQPST